MKNLFAALCLLAFCATAAFAQSGPGVDPMVDKAFEGVDMNANVSCNNWTSYSSKGMDYVEFTKFENGNYTVKYICGHDKQGQPLCFQTNPENPNKDRIPVDCAQSCPPSEWNAMGCANMLPAETRAKFTSQQGGY